MVSDCLGDTNHKWGFLMDCCKDGSGGEVLVSLYEDERIDRLVRYEQMPIIQSPTVFSYSLDAVLLADFVYVPIQRGQLLDLGTGNGVIPLLLSKRTKGSIVGLEIQERLAYMAERSVQLNDLTEKIKIVTGDLRERQPQLAQSYYDVVTCNPPYFKTPKATEYNKNEYLTIARHELTCTLEDVVRAAKRYVKPGGKVALVHRPERLVDILMLFRQYKIEPKRLRFVYPKQEKSANMLLIEGTRDGKQGLEILSPLYIYKEHNSYTEEAQQIIYGKT